GIAPGSRGYGPRASLTTLRGQGRVGVFDSPVSRELELLLEEGDPARPGLAAGRTEPRTPVRPRRLVAELHAGLARGHVGLARVAVLASRDAVLPARGAT